MVRFYGSQTGPWSLGTVVNVRHIETRFMSKKDTESKVEILYSRYDHEYGTPTTS